MSTEAPERSSASVPPAGNGTDQGTSTLADGELRRGLKNRHIQMIALGGAIGTGLFYGSATSIGMAGPSIVLSYLLGGAVIFLIMRALGEMSVHTPVSGAFSHYAFANWGPFAGFFSGWNYWFNYIAVSMAELAVVGIYVNYWMPGVPTWVSAAIFLVLITILNLTNVKAYGESEFWLAIIKVVAIVAMIGLGAWIILLGAGNGAHATGVSNLWAHGGIFPHGVWGMVTALVVVMFSFGGVELIGITAGEADNPRRTIPKAINQVVYRILIFYVGAIFVMLAIFPWNKIDAGGSPFVIIFDRIGIAGAATLLNVVVLTAAVSAYNSGLYSNGRMLYSLSRQGDAPHYLSRLNKSGSPYAGVLTSSAVTAVAVVLNFLFPGKVFLYLMSVALIAGIFNWAMVVITQMKFRKRIGAAEVEKLGFKMPFFPVANYVVLAFLAGVAVLMGFLPDFRYALYVAPVWVAILYVAYRIKTSAARRSSLTGQNVSGGGSPPPLAGGGHRHVTPNVVRPPLRYPPTRVGTLSALSADSEEHAMTITEDATELAVRAIPSERLAALGLDLPPVPEPVAAYLPTVRSGSWVWTSGQLPLVGGALPLSGKVGVGPGFVPPEEAARLARIAVLNAVAAAAAKAGGIDRIRRIVKLVGFVASDPSFIGQPAVVNGASELLGDLFGAAGAHARSAVGVAALPLDAPVEIELVVEVD